MFKWPIIYISRILTYNIKVSAAFLETIDHSLKLNLALISCKIRHCRNKIDIDAQHKIGKRDAAQNFEFYFSKVRLRINLTPIESDTR